MPIQYAYINGAFVQLARYSMQFGQAELFTSRQRYALPVLQTRLLLAERTSVQAQICAEIVFRQRIEITGDLLNRITAELVNRNRYFKDAYAELSVHPDLYGSKQLHLSLALHPQITFSPIKQGITCKMIRSIYTREYLSRHWKDGEAITSATCFIEPDGSIQNSNIGGILVIKGNNCIVPMRSEACTAQPANELICHAAASIGLQVFQACITEQDLQDADEVLFPSSASVLEWCTGYNQRRYFNRKFKLIAKFIMEQL